ncbi:adenylate/guanylate cyclase domain-containing protein [uncultured Enterovirga sp.]|uniref:adenylate/guanylate cyclase domain-containing protein n=1 Tax=uncultured Enterovirga sp. TaxID=2026352 RepID=UPI0035CC7CAD
MPILLFERGYVLSRWRVKLRKASTPTFFMLSVAVMVVAVAAGNAVAVSLLRYTQASGFNLEESPIPSRTTFIYSVAIATLLITAFRVRDLVGPKNLLSLIVGMHHKPVREVRVFLFLDLAGSTRFARQHGDVKALALLGRVFASLAGPVRKFGGEIDDYVGDMAVVTWRLKQGVDHAAVVRCLFEFLDEVEQDADQWRHDFGEVPRFRAALHCGSVLTAEIGLGRHKITYFGNVMNTTSRLESLAKELGIDVVVSTALLELLQPLPPGFRAEDLGVRMLRGHDEPLAVSALCRGAS